MEYLAFLLWCFSVSLAGGLVGLVLGNLRLPLTLLIASSPAAGAGANLLISASAAGSASFAHVRAGRVNWHLFAWMAPSSIAGAAAGGYLAGEMPTALLLGAIAAFLYYSAWELLRPRQATARSTARHGDPRVAALLGGLAIGLLGGFVGLILGSLRLPFMLRTLGETPHRAAGTNVLVGLCVGIAGAIGHLPSAPPDWRVAAIGAAASIPGALLGARLVGRLSEQQLLRAIAAVLVIAATATGLQAIT
jgi:uncharacterized membrane protein YfcA